MVEQLIDATWTRLGHPSDVNKLYRSSKELDDSVTISKVRAFLSKQDAAQLTKQKLHVHQGHITAFHKGVMQMDLVDMTNLSAQNRGFKYILLVIDIYSRMLYARPLKSKTATEVLHSLVDIIQHAPYLFESITSDMGSEFTNRQVEELASKLGTNLYFINASKQDHHPLGLIDRAVRTLRERLERHFIINKTANWVDDLPMVINSYNHTPHSSIANKSPYQVQDNDPTITALNLDKKRATVAQATTLKPGDTVRKRLQRNIFDKGTRQSWTKQTFTVGRVFNVWVELTDGTFIRSDNVLLVTDQNKLLL
eukprot:TRINITY_DN16279_c0_g1_i1.p1 TRINITY_DN16279_c0_g1~~TRINITY_DN16279_c0_g1_i1.p1  ORF type:complete len:310 (+),score=78.92 TRINITY_DN16279_c0_g1_i1:85-1014(+)